MQTLRRRKHNWVERFRRKGEARRGSFGAGKANDSRNVRVSCARRRITFTNLDWRKPSQLDTRNLGLLEWNGFCEIASVHNAAPLLAREHFHEGQELLVEEGVGDGVQTGLVFRVSGVLRWGHNRVDGTAWQRRWVSSKSDLERDANDDQLAEDARLFSVLAAGTQASQSRGEERGRGSHNIGCVRKLLFSGKWTLLQTFSLALHSTTVFFFFQHSFYFTQ